MALTANTLPAIPPRFTLPHDSLLEFASAQTLTATGYINNTAAVLTIGGGRFTGALVLDMTAFSHANGDETANIFILGSNDNSFGNGNVENLGSYDLGAAAHRAINTILGTNTGLVPSTGLAGTLEPIFFTNFRLGNVYQYLKCYAVIAGTTPSITLSAWVTPLEMKV